MNDDQMDQRLGEFADEWTADFTEPPVPKPAARQARRWSWVGPTALASLAAAAVVAVLVATNISDNRANPAVSPPSTESATTEPIESAITTRSEMGTEQRLAPDDLPETITIDGTVYRLGEPVPWYEAITDGASIAVTTGPEVRGACDRSFYRLRLTADGGTTTLTAFSYTPIAQDQRDCPRIGLPPAVATIALSDTDISTLVDGATGQTHPLRPLLLPANLPDGFERDHSYSADWPQRTDPERPAPYWTTLTWSNAKQTLELTAYAEPVSASADDEVTVRGSSAQLRHDPSEGSRCLSWNDATTQRTTLCSHGKDGSGPLPADDLVAIADSLAVPDRPDATEPSGTTPAASAPVPADLPLIGTTWYLVGRINNTLEMRFPAGRDAWIRFTDGTLTANAIEDDYEHSEGGSCGSLELPAVVTDDVIEFGEGAQEAFDDAGDLCDLWNLGFRQGKPHLEVHGREMRITVEWGKESTTNIYSADTPAEPTIPEGVDLNFLPPPTDQTAKERLSTGLRGRTFTATEITGREIADPGITMEFRTDLVRLYAGCNHGSSTFAINQTSATFDAGSWTLMGCGGPTGEQENWLTDFLTGTVDFERDGQTLRISRDGQTMTLIESSTAEGTPAPEEIGPDGTQFMIDEIVMADGSHPLPTLEGGQFWDREPIVAIYPESLIFDVGCGKLRSATTGEGQQRTAGAYDGRWWLTECPPKRMALADALRYILSGELHIDQDGPFVTITGRDGIKVTAHTSI